ncbi:hypothetical protein HYDPIDRAFT_101488 [Hydnomerulius pinastri MD-312]|uniref:Myb/SANT-like domain-containing protein n=1 Tax=Hydnomerulius pinastri MD-312 TaxID=994086 RepID=A0A0C9W8I8_9AGAM|nr:hypothetical protein HYDPIDRAFT_101488 [Hydnomerulius pinastri MD-312]
MIFSTNYTHLLQLKTMYTVIQTYRNQSGFHWDDVNGANIQGATAKAVYSINQSDSCTDQ